MADAPDLLSIGEQCAEPSCRQNDFLPFTCAACKQTFCLEHFRPAAHACARGSAEATAIVCPLCALAIKLRPDEDPNAAFEQHTREACDPSHYAKVHKRPRCPVPGCKERLTTVNSYCCKDCRATVCLKHRFGSDHSCPGRAAALAARAPAASAVTALRSALGLGGAASAATPARASARGDGVGGGAASSTARPAPAPQPRPARAQPAAAAAAAEAAQRRASGQARSGLAACKRCAAAAGGGAAAAPRGAREACPQCGERFGTLQELLFHAEAFHPAGAATGGGGGGGGGLERCPHCARQFRDAVAVEHVERVEREHRRGKACAMC